MRVIVGLRQLFPGKIGGLETYVRALLREWGEHHRDVEWIILVNGSAAATFASPGPWMRFETIDDPHNLAAWRQAAEKYSPAVYFSPLLTIDPPDVALPAVINIPDLQHFHYPEFFESQVLDFRRLHYPLSARRAAAIVTLSAHARDSIVARFGISPDKVHAIPLAPDTIFRLPATSAQLNAFRTQHHLPDAFGYYPANFWPHKNHEALFKALALYRRKYGTAPAIALSGFAGGNLDRVNSMIHRYRLEGDVHLLGYLERHELPTAYQAAEFLIFPSLFEGFGLPVAEAMACGCPVACAASSSLPELAGDAALTFEPRRVQEIAAALLALHTDAGLRRRLAKRGRERVAGLNWRATADRTRAVLDGVWQSATQQQRAPVIDVFLRKDGTPIRERLPNPQTPAVLHLIRLDSSAVSGSAEAASEFFRTSGLTAALGKIVREDQVAPATAPEMDIMRLKSEDYLHIESLWVGPAASQGLLSWLRDKPGVTPYEILLRVASLGPVGASPALETRCSNDSPIRVSARHGAQLSLQYFGIPDMHWLKIRGSEFIGRMPGHRFIEHRRRIHEALVKICAGLYYWSQARRLPPDSGKKVARLFSRTPDGQVNEDGWIGRQAVVECSRPASGIFKLVIDTPVWPHAAPLMVTVDLAGHRLYWGVLTRRGTYELSWAWPAGLEVARLRVVCSGIFVPAEHGISNDNRKIAVRLMVFDR